jgi:hypothetical protein
MLTSQLPLICSEATPSADQAHVGQVKPSLILRSARTVAREARVTSAPRPRLDDRTRQLGRDGVAAARAVLLEAARLREEPASLAA